MSKYFVLCLVFFSSFCVFNVSGRIHQLKLQNDNRHRMTLSTFGFLKGGTLAVNITLFSFKTTQAEAVNDKIFGFTLDKSNSPGLSNYVESMADCIWNKPEDTLVSVFFKFDLQNKQLNIERQGKQLQALKVVGERRGQYLFDNYLQHGFNYKGLEKEKAKGVTKKLIQGAGSAIKKDQKAKADNEIGSKDKETPVNSAGNSEPKEKQGDKPSRKRRAAIEEKTEKTEPGPKEEVITKKEEEKVVKDKAGGEDVADAKDKGKSTAVTDNKASGDTEDKPLPDKPIGLGSEDAEDGDHQSSTKEKKKSSVITSLPMTMSVQDSMAVYQTYFLVHIQTLEEEGLYNLFFHNCLHIDSLINLTLSIIEDNNGNYLSADEMPIPVLYFVFCVVFFILSCVWLSVLRSAQEGVYKLHYLMLVVVFVKSVSCLFHGINMYMIQKNGIHVDAWAILWYIVYLTRGALMFVTVLLIGAGWAFIKHVFSDKEKKLFLVVMPLQILANVAWVIVEESEEGTSSYTLWNRIFMVVDLLCCFAILFPVIWSIRHLQEASQTDGKAAINLSKLKLFRYFYIQVVCYIYFTRIIVYLLKITLPFHYGWMRNLCAEVFLLCFFTLTGRIFRPTSDNPYLSVPLDSDDEDIEMEEVLTKTGNMDSLTRVNQRGGGDEEEINRSNNAASSSSGTTSLKQRESSHEFD